MILPWVKWLLLQCYYTTHLIVMYRLPKNWVFQTKITPWNFRKLKILISSYIRPIIILHTIAMQHDWGLKRRMVNFAIAFFSKLPAISTKNKMSGHRYGHNGRCMLCAVLGGDRCMTLDIIEVLLWKKNPTTLLIKVVPTT